MLDYLAEESFDVDVIDPTPLMPFQRIPSAQDYLRAMIQIDGVYCRIISGGVQIPREPVPVVPPAPAFDDLSLDTLVELRQQYRYKLADLEAAITLRLAVPPRADHVPVDNGHEKDEYLTVSEVAGRIGYETQTVRNLMGQGVFRVGVHFVKPKGRVLFIWPAVEAWLKTGSH